MITFGPVPSRRLGRILGIDNIPSKHCTYSCVYCQLGKTKAKSKNRKSFYSPEDIFADVQVIIKKIKKKGENIDYIAFISSGEPTLDLNLGNTIDLIKLLGYKVAIISNGSLIWIDDVKSYLNKIDTVLFKIDTYNSENWTKINRPNKSQNFSLIKNELIEYASTKKFFTESTIMNQINSNKRHTQELAIFISKLNPVKAFIRIPTHPYSLKTAVKPDELTILKIYKIFSTYLPNVEILLDFENNKLIPLSNIEKDILNFVSIHPIKEDSLSTLLTNNNADWQIVDTMIEKKILKSIDFEGITYFIRSINN